MRFYNRTAAFTMVELLTVVLIVAVLAALTYPVITRAKTSARKTRCMTNLGQLGRALLIYAADYNDFYPNGADGRPAYAPSGPHVVDQLQPYTRETTIFRCPDDTGTQILDSYFIPIASSKSLFETLGSSYHYWFAGWHPQPSAPREAEPVDKRMAFYEGSGAWHSGQALVPLRAGILEWADLMKDYRYNAVFFDGHVKYLTRSQWQHARDINSSE